MAIVLFLKDLLVDDSFIYLRVVDNLLSGQGWVYNRGEFTNPCTSGLYVLLLAAIGLAGVRGPAQLLLAFGLGLAAVAIVHYRVFRTVNRTVALAVVTATLADVFLLRSVGLETSIFIACIVTASWAYQRRRPTLVGVVAGLAPLLRPEGFALIPLIVFADVLFYRAVCWRSVLIAGAIVSPWIVFSWWYFGTPVSHSIAVKAAQSSVGWWAEQPTWLIAFIQAQPFWYLTLPLGVLGAVYAYRRLGALHPFLFIWIGFCVTQVVAYSVLGAPAGYWWYFVPGTQALITLIVPLTVSAPELLRPNRELSAWRSRSSGLVAKLFVVLVALVLLVPALLLGPHPKVRAYAEIAAWLVAHTPSDVRVAAGEIGYIGYYSQRPIVDIHGLLHRDALRSIRAEGLSWWFRYRPEFIIRHDNPLPGEPSAQWRSDRYEDFMKEYRPVYRSWTLILFQRQGR